MDGRTYLINTQQITETTIIIVVLVIPVPHISLNKENEDELKVQEKKQI